MKKKFEYKIISYRDESLESDARGKYISYLDFLNKYGEDGWELIFYGEYCIFKRETRLNKPK